MAWRLSGGFGEHVGNDDRIGIQTVYNAPSSTGIDDPQFVTPASNGRHGSRMRHPWFFAALQSAQQGRHLPSAPPPSAGAS